MKAGKKNIRPAAADSQPARPATFTRAALVVSLRAVALPFFLLAIVEVCLRLAGYGYNPDFFKRIPIGGQDFFVQNEDFSFRFFPKNMVRNPGPLRFPVHKDPRTFRIFILGESAAMGDPAESFAPDRYLEMLLREKYPEQILKSSIPPLPPSTPTSSCPSPGNAPLARVILWIVYMGNNEMVGPYGAATVFGRQAPALPYARLTVALQKLRLGQWFTDLGRRFTGGKQERAAWGGMEMFLNNQVPPGSPMRETVYQNFQKNLDDIVRAGIQFAARLFC